MILESSHIPLTGSSVKHITITALIDSSCLENGHFPLLPGVAVIASNLNDSNQIVLLVPAPLPQPFHCHPHLFH